MAKTKGTVNLAGKELFYLGRKCGKTNLVQRIVKWFCKKNKNK